jgi:hypothetical protein
MRRLLTLLALVLSLPLLGASSDGTRPRHYVVTLVDGADASGFIVQRPLSRGRMLVVGDREVLQADPRVASVEPFDASKKVFASARKAAVSGRPFVTLNVTFHDDVSFDDAQRAINAAGGTTMTSLPIDFDSPHRVRARVPATAVETLAADEAVFAITSRTLAKKSTNANAARISNVTPLFSAPYNLDGDGMVLSEFELGAADATNPEFTGRLTLHFTTATNREHATHVAGTMIAAGLDARAKGMAPAATLHAFDANVDPGPMQDLKEALPSFGVVADNNSWDFSLGWQVDPDTFKWVWYGVEDEYGAYDPDYSTPYEESAVKSGMPLLVHSSGNDAANGHPSLSSPWSPHLHTDDSGKTIKNETFCYSQNGTGTDCPVTSAPNCSAGTSTLTHERHCETAKHPTYGPPLTVGLIASTKNVLSVGAVDANGNVTGFSSQGPTRDGRVKPEVVAKGTCQFSTWLTGKSENFSSCAGTPPPNYALLDGTSMSAPVVTGISALVAQQWRKTFGSGFPNAPTMKALLIAGATDLGNAGPDYVYGFGLVDAKNSVDLVIADAGAGLRIRRGSIRNGETLHIPMTLAAAQPVRIVLEWFDPEFVLSPDDDLHAKTLLNDLDVRVVGPDGSTTFPYVLNPNQPSSGATRGINNIDTTEEVEIRNAPAGTYDIVVHGTLCTGCSPAQDFVVVANAPLAAPAPPAPGPRRRSVRH